MRILVIGGTAFVGRHFADAALAAGHDVTLFHRGKTGSDLFPQATHLTGDRNSDLSALAAGDWDATVDVCAYFPRQVRSLAAALGGRGGRLVHISSVSAYKLPVPWGYDESAPLADCEDPEADAVTPQNYGGLKAACERTAIELHGAGTTIIRPTYVIGPYDYSCRFTWWVDRVARGGTVLAPGHADDPIQVIDARDMAAWIVSMLDRSVTGTFHAVSPAPPFGFGQMLDAIASAVAPAGSRFAWVDSDFLVAEGVDGAALPLWGEGDPDEANANAASPAAAFAAGLSPRPLADTVTDVSAEARAAVDARPGAGMPPEQEAALLDRWAARSGR
ncbi:MAG TPA: NAD-dependent epimerase/dehydratase family protein [Streptosporangiaceae bacterium]|nr:NAD-dependent epimerase/dehydratase family protein [Streptosporangiaceae bacterium]